MKKTFMTDKRAAYFNVRKYDDRLPREQRPIAADTDTITVTMIYDLESLPRQYVNEVNELDEFVRAFRSKEDETKYKVAVTFKIGRNCRWYDKTGKETARPANVWLDEHHLDVQISYARLDKVEGKPTAPCGYWANAIMFRERDENVFAGQAFEEPSKQEEPKAQIVEEQDGDLLI